MGKPHVELSINEVESSLEVNMVMDEWATEEELERVLDRLCSRIRAEFRELKSPAPRDI